MALAGLLVQIATRRKDRHVLTRVSLRRAHVADAAVPVLDVVPMHEVGRPSTCRIEIGEAARGELRPVLRRAELTCPVSPRH